MGLLLRLTAVALFALVSAASAHASGFSLTEFGITGTPNVNYTLTGSDGNNYVISGEVNGVVVEQIFSSMAIPVDATYLSTASGCEAYYAQQESYNRANNNTTYDNYQYALCTRMSGGGWHCVLNRDNPTYKCHYAIVNMSSSCTFRQQFLSQCGNPCTASFCNTLDHWGAWENTCLTISSLDRENERLYYDYSCGTLQCYLYGITDESQYLSSCSTSCSFGVCNGGASCTESSCDAQNYYGAWEYYCNGNEKRQHRRYYDYTCSGGSCSLASQNYTGDSLVENCAYGCSAGTCSAAPSCSNYCSGNVRYYNGVYSGGSCSYSTENCDALDGYACNGNAREYRNYYCAPSACAYTVDQSTNCDTLDTYGNWEYYCSGSERRKHRMFYNYSCSGSSCSETHSYVDDALVENCAFGCSGGMCSGCSASIVVDVEDYYDNPVVNANVYLNGNLQGVTNGEGRITLSASASACPATHAVRVAAADGIDCTTKNVTNRNNGDNKFMMFTCNVQQPQLKMGVASGDPHYLGDDMTFGIEVKDSANSLISGASVGIWDPLKQMKVWKSTLAGIVEYLTNASRTGYFTFLFSASKPGYKAGSAEKGVLVKGFGEIVVNAQTKDGAPIAGASVKIDGASLGSTDAQGKFAIEMGQGTHTVEVCANGYCMSKSTEITHNGDVDELKFEFEGAGLQVNVTEPNGYPLANVYVSLDGVHKGISNPFGIVYMEGVHYGSHKLGFDLNVANPDYAGLYHGSKQVSVDEKLEAVNAKIALSGSGISVSEFGDNAVLVAKADGNVSAEFLFIPAVLLLVDIASITWSTNDWCQCVYKNPKGEEFAGGLAGCVDAIKSCSGDVRNCMQIITQKAGTTAAECAFEEAMLVGDVASPFIPAGMIGHAAVWVGSNGAAVIGAVGKVVKIADEPKAWSVVEKGIDKIAKYIDNLGIFRKFVDVGLDWTRSWGIDAQRGLERIVEYGKSIGIAGGGKNAGRSFATIIEARYGREYAEKTAAGIAKLERKFGSDALRTRNMITEITNVALDSKRLPHHAVVVDFASDATHIDNVAEIFYKPTTRLVDDLEVDLILKNGDLLEFSTVRWDLLDSATKSDRIAQLVSKYRRLRKYHPENTKRFIFKGELPNDVQSELLSELVGEFGSDEVGRLVGLEVWP